MIQKSTVPTRLQRILSSFHKLWTRISLFIKKLR